MPELDSINLVVRADIREDRAMPGGEKKNDTDVIFDGETATARRFPESWCVRKRASCGLALNISTRFQNCSSSGPHPAMRFLKARLKDEPKAASVIQPGIF